jgi:hypothetical protein
MWHEYRPHLSKSTRYTIGEKIDGLFVEIIEALYVAGFMKPGEKLPYLLRAVRKLDLLKFFLQVAWEIKELDEKKYISLSLELDEVGRQLGAWYRRMEKETPVARK